MCCQKRRLIIILRYGRIVPYRFLPKRGLEKVKHHYGLPRPHEKPHLYGIKTNFMEYNIIRTKIIKRLGWKVMPIYSAHPKEQRSQFSTQSRCQKQLQAIHNNEGFI